MRLIDADAATELLRSLGSRDCRMEKGTIMDAVKMLSHPMYTPTVDAVPVVHGRFVDGECTICRWFGDCCDTPHYNFCPNCGAKIDGAVDDDA